MATETTEPKDAQAVDAGEEAQATGGQRAGLPLIDAKNRFVFRTGSSLVGGVAGGGLAYERAVHRYLSLDIAFSFFRWSVSSDAVWGISGGVGTSVFFTGEAPNGWNLNLAFDFGGIFFSDESAFTFGTSLMAGYKWCWYNNFTLGLGAGVAYMYLGSGDFDFGGVNPGLKIDFGFSW